MILGVHYKAMLFSLGISQLVLNEIEIFLTELHDKYTKIYPIYYANRKRNILSGFLGGRTRPSTPEIELSQRYYDEILLVSDNLKHKLRIFESQLMSMSEEKFDKLSCFTENEKIMPIMQETQEVSEDEGAYYYGARGR